ncbi:MAG: GTP-binding protein [Myxococcota bacterium]
MQSRSALRNIAIIAHVDHGKTTLVDALFAQGGLYGAHQEVVDRAMDSNDQERERGITILAKATSVPFGDVTLQIVDTPGHADFGGEVERTLRMVDGVLLLVDAAEGPLPQTRFVLRKALELGLKPIVVINKIDRADARAPEVLDEVYDLFIDLGADDAILDFPVLYAVAREGTATTDLDKPGTNLRPLVDAIIAHVPCPEDTTLEPFCMQVNQLAYDEYVGRLIIGRIISGSVKVNQSVTVSGLNKAVTAKVTGVFNFRGTKRNPLSEAFAGDIIALAGIETVTIGDTVHAPDQPRTLRRIQVDEPTVAMVFQINDGPMAGRSGGKFVTSRQLRDRLHREAYANVSIQITDGDTLSSFECLDVESCNWRCSSSPCVGKSMSCACEIPRLCCVRGPRVARSRQSA